MRPFLLSHLPQKRHRCRMSGAHTFGCIRHAARKARRASVLLMFPLFFSEAANDLAVLAAIYSFALSQHVKDRSPREEAGWRISGSNR